jgi:hypothetical protein
MAQRPSKRQSKREVAREITSRLNDPDYGMAKDLIQKGSSSEGWLEANMTKWLINNDDGLFALEKFLKDYKRISVSTACKALNIKHLHVWLYIDSYWIQWPQKKVDKFLKSLSKLDAKTSVCHALMTNEFKLSDVQYQTMKNTFLSSTWRDVAGLYQNLVRNDDFAVVVRVQVDAGLVKRVALGGALGATSPELVESVKQIWGKYQK